MSATGKGDFPLCSPLVSINSLLPSINFGIDNQESKVMYNNFFFGNYIAKRWNGSQWVLTKLKVWNGSSWVLKPLKEWNGTNWVTVQSY